MATWGEIDRVAARQREAFAARDAAGARRLLVAYDAARADLAAASAQFEADLAARIAAGESPDRVAWRMVRSQHYREMLRQLDAETARLRAALTSELGRAVPVAAGIGAAHASELLLVATGTAFDVLDTAALEAITAAVIGPDSPLGPVLASLGDVGRAAAERELIAGIAAGRNPNEVARRIVAQARQVTLSRAQLIARTETLRAYRASELESYAEVADTGVITGWAWHAALDRRTCACCWALHGTVYSTAEPMGAHPACRCAMVPVTRRLGPPLDGATRFRGLSDAAQREILGPAAHAAYKAGDLDLPDLVRTRTSPEWGVTRSRGSLVDAVGPSKAQRYYASARS